LCRAIDSLVSRKRPSIVDFRIYRQGPNFAKVGIRLAKTWPQPLLGLGKWSTIYLQKEALVYSLMAKI
jgi:hypothetical protein